MACYGLLQHLQKSTERKQCGCCVVTCLIWADCETSLLGSDTCQIWAWGTSLTQNMNCHPRDFDPTGSQSSSWNFSAHPPLASQLFPDKGVLPDCSPLPIVFNFWKKKQLDKTEARAHTCFALGTFTVVVADSVNTSATIVAGMNSTVINVVATVIASPAIDTYAEVGAMLVLTGATILTGSWGPGTLIHIICTESTYKTSFLLSQLTNHMY